MSQTEGQCPERAWFSLRPAPPSAPAWEYAAYCTVKFCPCAHILLRRTTHPRCEKAGVCMCLPNNSSVELRRG